MVSSHDPFIGVRETTRATPPDTAASAAAKRPNYLPWWLKPVGVVFLAVASVVLGAVGLPSLQRPAPRREAEVEHTEPVEWRSAVLPAPAPEPEERPTRRTVAVFDKPAVAPRTPSATGPYALAAVIDREIDKALRDAKITSSPAAGDAEFFRRVHLDLIGRIPALSATRSSWPAPTRQAG